jgi:hypothetical protein
MQHIFLPASTISESLRKNARCFFEDEGKILDSMHNFTDGWFERRHVGAHLALEAADRMCKAETPVDLLREYQDWAKGAFERGMADGLACQQQFMAVIGVLPRLLAPLVGDREAEASQSDTKTPVRTKAA